MLEVHAAGLALPARARADHEIVRAAHDRIDKLIHERWDIAAVAIQKHYDLAFGRNRANARRACAPIATRRCHHTRASFARAFGGAIAAAIIDNDHFIGNTGRETFAHHARDRFFLVECRNNDGDLAHRKTSQPEVK